MEAGILETIYTARDEEFNRVADRVDRRFTESTRNAQKNLREAERTAERARAAHANALESLVGRLPGGSRLSQFKALSEDIKLVTGSSQGATGALAALGGGATLAVAGVGALAVGAAAAGVAVVKTTLDFVEFASSIHDLGVETGLAAETLTTISAYGKLAGVSVQQASNSLAIYLKNASQAAHGNEAMAKTFQRFGIDAKKAIQDPDQAARDLFDSLAKIPNSAERLDASFKLAGRSGRQLALIANEMDGNFAKAQQAAREWGVILSEDDVRAADRFGDAMAVMGLKVQGILYSIGRGALPEIETALENLSGGIRASGASWEEFGRDAGKVLGETASLIREAVGALESYLKYRRAIQAVMQSNTPAEAVRRVGSALNPPNEDPFGPGGRMRGGGSVNSPVDIARAIPDISTGGVGDVLARNKKVRQDELDSLKRFAKEWEFTITSVTGGRHNKGSLHGQGRALDVSVRGKANEEIERMMRAARDSGFGVRDERTRHAGQKVWSGPHIHLELLSKAAQASAKDTQEAWQRVGAEIERASERGFDAFIQGEEETRKALAEGARRVGQEIEDASERGFDAFMQNEEEARAALIAGARKVGQEIERASEQSFEAFIRGEEEARDAALKAAEDRREHMRDVASDVADIFSGVFGQIGEGWDGLWDGMRQTALSVIQQIGQSLIQSLLTGQQSQSKGIIGFLTNSILGAFAGGLPSSGITSGGILGTLTPGATGRGFAAGGYLPPGQWGVAGEKGPEPIFGGRAGLTVIPNQAGGTVINNNTTIIYQPKTTPDSYGTRKQARETFEALLGSIK